MYICTLYVALRERCTRAVQVEVVGVIAIIRHGERTPKQKAKLKTKLKTWVELYNSLRKGEKEVKIKSPSQLTMVMKRVRRLLMRATGLGEAMSATSSGTSSGEDIVVGEEAPTVAEIQFCKTLLQVLERYPLQGINRKVPLHWACDVSVPVVSIAFMGEGLCLRNP